MFVKNSCLWLLCLKKCRINLNFRFEVFLVNGFYFKSFSCSFLESNIYLSNLTLNSLFDCYCYEKPCLNWNTLLLLLLIDLRERVLSLYLEFSSEELKATLFYLGYLCWYILGLKWWCHVVFENLDFLKVFFGMKSFSITI